MPSRISVNIGRPRGSTKFDARLAQAFGLVVRMARNEAGISQEALAAMANLDRTTMSRLERGINEPTLGAISAIAYALGHDASTLVEMTHQLFRDTQKKTRRST